MATLTVTKGQEKSHPPNRTKLQAPVCAGLSSQPLPTPLLTHRVSLWPAWPQVQSQEELTRGSSPLRGPSPSAATVTGPTGSLTPAQTWKTLHFLDTTG